TCAGLSASRSRARSSCIEASRKLRVQSRTRTRRRSPRRCARRCPEPESEAAAVELGSGSYALGFLAGVLTILSPCVLPLLPIIVGTALAAHPFGAAALALGLALSFTGVGLFVATVGFAVGLDTDGFRTVAGVVLIGSVSRRLFSTDRGKLLRVGAYGQFALGVLIVALGLLIVTGWDRSLEAYLVEISPAWLTDLTTRY